MFAITDRLLLRPGWPEDAPVLAAALGADAVSAQLVRVPRPYRLQDAEAWLAIEPAPDRPRFLLFRLRSNELVGGIGFTGEGEPEIGYWIAQGHWGCGLATEAGRALVAMADHGLGHAELVSAHAPDNPASGRVLAKLGFRPDGDGVIHSAVRGVSVPVRRMRRVRGDGVPR